MDNPTNGSRYRMAITLTLGILATTFSSQALAAARCAAIRGPVAPIVRDGPAPPTSRIHDKHEIRPPRKLAGPKSGGTVKDTFWSLAFMLQLSSVATDPASGE